jgi:dTDP-4-amino-4,6-dideoxygalactose transaminase
MTALLAIARRHGVALIEDCSQAYWAEWDGKLVGTMGDLAAFSLQQSKHITCGEGGLMVTNNDDWSRRARLFADKAWPRDAKSLGSCRFLFLSQNYRMSELPGAVALAQLGKVEASVASRRARAAQLTGLLSGDPRLIPPVAPPPGVHSYWLYMLSLDRDARAFGDALTAQGVPAWVQYIVDPLYFSPIFAETRTYGASGYPLRDLARQKYEPGLCPNAEAALKKVVAILWNENYTEAHVEQIAAAIHTAAGALS